MSFVTGSGQTADGSSSYTGTIDEGNEDLEFTPPGRRGDTAWIGWFWSKGGEGASVLSLQFKPAATWRTLYTSTGTGSSFLPTVTDSYMAMCGVPYRFVCLTADFVAGDSFTIEVV